MEVNFLHAERNYDLELLKFTVKSTPTDIHPLQSNLPNLAPEPAAAAEVIKQNEEQPEEKQQPDEPASDPWLRLKSEIQKHSEKHVGADESIELMGDPKNNIQQEVKAGKGKSRMGELDTEKKQEMETLSITKSEYKKQMQILLELLPKLWVEHRRVDGLKIVIQCAKLLNTVESASFYPEKFIAISDIFEHFSRLVFKRIKDIALKVNPDSPIADIEDSEIRPEIVPEQAKEICINWFLKTAIIREVVPRCFVEICLCKCYFFISSQPIKETLERIAKSIRGVSEPLAAMYLSVYLARVGMDLDPKSKEYMLLILENVYNILDLAKKRGFPGISLDDYLSCYDMAIHWLVCSLCDKASQTVYDTVLKIYQKNPANAKVLKSIVAYSTNENVSVDASRLIEMAKLLPTPGQVEVLTELANKFIKSPPQMKRTRLEFMNYAWNLSKNLTDGESYMNLVIALTEFAIKYLKVEKIDFLQEIFQKCKSLLTGAESVQLSLCGSLEKLLLKVIGTSSSVTEVLSIDSLVPLFDYFNVNIKKKLCGMILTTVMKNAGNITDTVTAHTLLGLGKIVHDSVDFLASEQEVANVGQTLREVIKKIDFGRDLEQQLKILSQARGIFIDFDQVTDLLVQKALFCSEQCLHFMKYRHTRKSLGFVKMCISFAMITIPGLKSQKLQLTHYLDALRCALSNSLISETDSLYRTSLKLICTLLDFPETENLMEAPLNTLLGLAVMIPGDPSVSGFKLIEETLDECLIAHKWSPKCYMMKLRVLLNFIGCVTTLLQNKLPYHAFKVDANDSIFINDEIYLNCGKGLVQRAVQEVRAIVTEVDKLVESPDQKQSNENVAAYYKGCLRAANVLMAHTKPTANGLKIVQWLITQADKYEKLVGDERIRSETGIDVEFFKNTMNFYNKRFGDKQNLI